MKRFIQRPVLRSILTIFCLLTIPISQAASTTTVFSAPTEYCFPQTVLRGELNKTTLEHNLIIATADHFKNGNVFVGFHLKSRPDALWLLTSSLTWTPYDGSKDPVAFYTGQLQPVIPATIIFQPLDLTAFSGDGEILLGYGLRNSTAATVKDSFQDMVSNQRYSTIWAISSEQPQYWQICLTATQMRVDGGPATISQQ